MFHVSLNPFRRRIAEKRRQQSAAGNFQKLQKLDNSDFSIDGFLSRISTFHQKPKLPSSTRPPTALPSKPTNTLSTKCFLEIFKYIPAKELPMLRIVCKEFNQIIQNHAIELNLIPVDSVSLRQESVAGRFVRSMPNQQLPNLRIEKIDSPLRHLQTDSLNLCEVSIDLKVMKYLLRSFKYQISSIFFDQCQFFVSADKLARLISPWKPKSLEFQNCLWNFDVGGDVETNFDQLFIDFFFSRHQKVDSLTIDFSNMPLQKLQISDKLAQIFNDSQKLPSVMIFRNCSTNITAKTLHNALWSYIEAVNAKAALPQSLTWSFGQISDSEDTVCSIMNRFSEYILSEKRDGNRLEIVFQIDADCPILNFIVEFQPMEELNGVEKEDDENLSDIEWDDTVTSADFFSQSESFLQEPIESS